MMDNWEDDDVFVLGAFEEERQTQKKASRRDVSTRNQRPVSSWTSGDILAEFRDRVEMKCPALRHRLPFRKNPVILASMRKRHETTPEVELALMELYLAKSFDPAYARRNADAVYPLWFKSWTKYLEKAREMVENAPQDALYAPEGRWDDTEVRSASSEAPRGLLVASDGRQFPDTNLGRLRLNSHERWLKK